MLYKLQAGFPVGPKISHTGDISGKSEFNFFFEDTLIGWRLQTNGGNIEVVRSFDFSTNKKQEFRFQIPAAFRDLQPIIIAPDKLFFAGMVLNSDNTIDTLRVPVNTYLPHFNRVFMRRNSFMVDWYYGQANPKSNVGAIQFFKVSEDRLEVHDLNVPGLKISNYKIECNFNQIWFLSHKINPEKFLLYDVSTGKGYPFTLDSSIFRLENFQLIKPVDDELNPYDVKFSYHASMTEKALYLVIINNGIKVYKVEIYLVLLR